MQVAGVDGQRDGSVRPGAGHVALLGGGIGLVAANVAGITGRSALRVLSGTLVTLLGLAGLLWMWVLHGVPA